MTPDGLVIVGNTATDYETFRWTKSGGQQLLGRATLPVLGVGAGAPSVSDDGKRVSATVLCDDSTCATMGLWTEGAGWKTLVDVGRPTLPDGRMMDKAWGSAWGISGNGSTVAGLYWRNDAKTGDAHAWQWTEGKGAKDLGSGGGSRYVCVCVCVCILMCVCVCVCVCV
jgi:uncharacterized membrane protein